MVTKSTVREFDIMFHAGKIGFIQSSILGKKQQLRKQKSLFVQMTDDCNFSVIW